MAQRVGKYKITKRESALNLTDGGTVTWNLIISSLNGSSTDPGVAGQVYATGSVAGAGALLGKITGSSFFVLASQG